MLDPYMSSMLILAIELVVLESIDYEKITDRFRSDSSLFKKIIIYK